MKRILDEDGVDIEQGSDAWAVARIGIPTSSKADKIFKPKERKRSTQDTKYRRELLAEWLTGRAVDAATSGFMQRGSVMEQEALQWYEFTKGVNVERVGFVTRDDGMFGYSPDGFVGDDGTTEVKCYELVHHVTALLEDDDGHIGQCMSGLYVTGRKWCDRIYYHPTLPPVVKRIYRDDDWIADFVPVLDTFIATLRTERAYLAETYKCAPIEPVLDDGGRRMPF